MLPLPEVRERQYEAELKKKDAHLPILRKRRRLSLSSLPSCLVESVGWARTCQTGPKLASSPYLSLEQRL
jgi:hypothetical protein